MSSKVEEGKKPPRDINECAACGKDTRADPHAHTRRSPVLGAETICCACAVGLGARCFVEVDTALGDFSPKPKAILKGKLQIQIEDPHVGTQETH